MHGALRLLRGSTAKEWWDLRAQKHTQVGSAPYATEGLRRRSASLQHARAVTLVPTRTGPPFACQEHFIPTTNKTMVGTGSKEVLEGPVLPRDEECRLLCESCQSRRGFPVDTVCYP